MGGDVAKRVVEVRFAPGRSGHFVRVHVAEDVVEAERILGRWDPDHLGLCRYDHEAKGDHKCTIVLLSEHLSIPLIVHECTHAAQEWVVAESMPVAMKREPEEKWDEYYSEALAWVNEALVRQCLVLVGMRL